jgi:hypothetical protein
VTSPTGSEERRALLVRNAHRIGSLLLPVLLPTLHKHALFLLDVTDPLAYALCSALHTRIGEPDPDRLLRVAKQLPQPCAPIAAGLMSVARLAAIAAQTSPTFDHVAEQLLESARPYHVRVVVVAAIGGEVIHMHLARFARAPE